MHADLDALCERYRAKTYDQEHDSVPSLQPWGGRRYEQADGAEAEGARSLFREVLIMKLRQN